jgi:hypothetical protein
MAFEDVAKRMANRHNATAPALVDTRQAREWWKNGADKAPPSPEPVLELAPPQAESVPKSAFAAFLGLWGGMVVMVASGLFGALTFGNRLYFRLALLGVGVGISLMVWGARRD